MEGTEIVVVGLGYVGLPLANSLAKKFDVIGFDISREKIELFRSGIDVTGEIGNEELKRTKVSFTYAEKDIVGKDIYIIAVPTPIQKNNLPDLEPLRSASKLVGRNLTKCSIVIFESTVYPGITEDFCGSIIERTSNLRSGEDFKLAYSPERINPGDKVHTFENILKIVSAHDEETLETVSKMYGAVVKAGIYEAPSIKVAEAAKVIENTQRDINIAFMNELSIIFNRMGIDTKEVLKAAGTKWNFLNFSPGLVGGHCIGVDPYYLKFKAEELGYHPEIITAGRRLNDGMGKWVAEQTVKQLIKNGKNVNGARIAVLGITFKEDVPDVRNSRVKDIVMELLDYGVDLSITDPHASEEDARKEYGFGLTKFEDLPKCDAVILAVPHKEYITGGLETLLKLYRNSNGVLIDVKYIFDKDEVTKNGLTYWSL